MSILLQIWVMVGTWVFMRAVHKLIQEEQQISNPDRSYYRRSDNSLLRPIFYFFLWCTTGPLLYALWLYITGQLHITGRGA